MLSAGNNSIFRVTRFFTGNVFFRSPVAFSRIRTMERDSAFPWFSSKIKSSLATHAKRVLDGYEKTISPSMPRKTLEFVKKIFRDALTRRRSVHFVCLYGADRFCVFPDSFFFRQVKQCCFTVFREKALITIAYNIAGAVCCLLYLP